MIKLKPKVNKVQLLKELRVEAEKTYNSYWECELRIKAYMKGVRATLKRLKDE